MEYKVLIKLYIPEVERDFELYIPINKTVYQVLELIMQVIEDLVPGVNLKDKNLNLCNRRSNNLYKKDLVIRNTDIRNGTELVLF